MKKIFILILSLNASHPLAENLLANGSFDSDLNGWNSPFTDCDWFSSDGAPITGAGSMLCSTDLNNNGSFGPFSDPVPAKPGFWYLAAASFKTPAESTSERGLFYIEWFDNKEVMLHRDEVDGGFGVADDVWLPLDGYFKAPENTAFIEFRVLLQSGKPGVDVDPAFGLWDDVFFMEDTIFFSGFD